MTRLAIYGAAVAGIFAAGLWMGAEWQIGRHARALAAQTAADDLARAAAHAIAAAQLAAEYDLGKTVGEIVDEARGDPDAGLRALGLRDAQRLNRIR